MYITFNHSTHREWRVVEFRRSVTPKTHPHTYFIPQPSTHTHTPIGGPTPWVTPHHADTVTLLPFLLDDPPQSTNNCNRKTYTHTHTHPVLTFGTSWTNTPYLPATNYIIHTSVWIREHLPENISSKLLYGLRVAGGEKGGEGEECRSRKHHGHPSRTLPGSTRALRLINARQESTPDTAVLCASKQNTQYAHVV